MSIRVELELSRTSCCVCGCAFAIPRIMHEKRRAEGGEFFCPNGHPLVFKESRVASLARELESVRRALINSQVALREERQLVLKIKAEASARSEKKRRRINAGVCPHCQRSFQALARHIRTKHPAEPLPNQKYE